MLDDIKNIKKIDSKNMLGSLQLLYKQVEQIYQESNYLEIPKSYKKVKNIVVFGMGGSALGAQVIKNVFANNIKISLEIVNDYNVPKFVNNNTLAICSSYSGSTEEVLTVFEELKKRHAKIIVIAAGGKLASFAKINKLPALVFKTENNPCSSPRMGLGYSIFGQIILLNKIGILKISQKYFKEIVATIAFYDSFFGVLTPKKENIAKQLAEKMINFSVFYVASEHLVGNAHIAANQMNENAKRFAAYFTLPELNHHLLEGMAYPESNKKNLFFVLFKSKNYFSRTQKRYDITTKVLQKNQIKNFVYETKEKDKILEMCELLVLGSYVSYYLAILKKIDPTAIPYVDFFKKRMGN
ncbi:MAG: SIS domain-containing protein [Patescibacteria group bacterium]